MGVPAYSTNGWIEEMSMQYRFEYEVVGTLSGIGKAESSIYRDTFQIIDLSTNKPVTDEVMARYNIKLESGIIQLYAEDLIILGGNQYKTYDGEAIVIDETNYECVLSPSNPNHNVIVTFTYAQNGKAPVNVCKLLNEFTVEVRDNNGADVTDQYRITSEYGELIINPIVITLTADDVIHYYDPENPETVTATTWTQEGKTLDNHTLTGVSVVGSASALGSYVTIEMKYVDVVDENENSVADNYKVICVNGTLEIKTKPQP